MKLGWLLGGWLFAMAASAGPALWVAAGYVHRNPLGKYVDEATGAYTPLLYEMVLRWWLPIAVPVTLLALACLVMNRRAD